MDARRLAPSEFAARHACCFLLPIFDVPAGDSWAGAAPQTVKIAPTWEEEPTGVTDIGEARRQDVFGDKLYAVRKVQTLYQSMISVGRTSNNDIVLADASVSKFHAHFRLNGEVYYLLDAGSKNGTLLDGQQLVPKQPALVIDGAVISFGGLRFRFLSAFACHSAISAR